MSVVLVSGLRGPMMQCRRYVVIDDLPTNAWHWSTDISEATVWTPGNARAWSIEQRLWPGTVHNWTTGFVSPPSCP